MNITGNIILAMGGLALLLFGIKMVSTGLEVVAGDQLQIILKRATANRFLAAFVGMVATVLINSSTAVSVITVGFVNAGLMNLTQAIGVLLGINVGTTFSAQLIAFRIDQYAPIFMLIGVVMHLFFKKLSIWNIGYAILGFGILFFSITVMSDALRIFRTMPQFTNLIEAISNPILALLVGFIFTVIVQSSSATMGLLVTMHLSGVEIPFLTSAFIVFGANIGTSVTAVIASIPASRDSKRTALFHISYDLIGSLVFGTLIILIPGILTWFQTTWYDSARQVAMFHTLYNVATLLLLIGFVPLLSKLMQLIIPVRKDEKENEHERRLIYLDSKSSITPTTAAMYARLEISRMGKIASENLKLATDAFFEKDVDKANKILESEKTVNFLQQGILSELVEYTDMPMTPADAKKIADMFVILSDIEQIGDHAENIAEFVIDVNETSKKFSDIALEELRTVSEKTMELIDISLTAYEKEDKSILLKIKEMEDEIDDMTSKYAKNHFKRLKAKLCKPRSGVVFMDILNDLEKSADNAEKIALSMVL